ncbi:unnamed protein product [Closterium sp. NIES-54]
MFPGEKAGPYINRCRNRRDQFRKSGGNFSDDMFVTIILAGLSPEWHQCKSLLCTQGTLSETALCSTLLSKQKEIDLYNERGNKKEKIAFYAQAPPDKKILFCKYCKKTGHMIQDCWKLNGNNNNQKGAAAHQQGGAAARNQTVSPPAVASTSQAPARLTANTSDKGKSKVLTCMVHHGPPRPNSHYRFFRNWEDMFAEPPQERPKGSVEEEEENDPTYDELTVGRMQFDWEAPEWIQESPPARIAYNDEGCYYDYENDHDMEHHITPKLANLAKTRKEVNTWYLDSCCGQHMVSSDVFILNRDRLFNEVEITVANNQTIYARSRGQVQMESHDTSYCIHISDVLIVPKLRYNLLSLHQLMKCGVGMQTTEDEMHLIYNGIFIGKATSVEGVFVLDFESPRTSGDNEHILVLDPPGHPLDGTFRALAVPVASTTNPAETGPQAVEEGEEITSETAVETTEPTSTQIFWPSVERPTGWNTTKGWDAVDMRRIMENTAMGEAIAAETGWGNIANVLIEEAAEEPKITEEAPEAEEEESLMEYGPHLLPITTDGRNYFRLETRGVAIGDTIFEEEEIAQHEDRHARTAPPHPEKPLKLPVTMDTVTVGDTSGTYHGVTIQAAALQVTMTDEPADETRQETTEEILAREKELYSRTKGYRADGDIWHQRMGHPSIEVLNNSINANVFAANALLLPDGKLLKPRTDLPTCTVCPAAVLCHTPFAEKIPGAERYKPLEKVYSDFLVLTAKGVGGEQYTLTFIDAGTRFVWAVNVKDRYLAYYCFKVWLAMAENQSDGYKLKAFQTDGALEYMSDDFKTLCKQKGIKRMISLPYAHEQQGLAERTNRSLTTKMRALMKQSAVPTKYWPFAMAHAVRLHNILSSKALPNNSSPFKEWTGKHPDARMLRVFGCMHSFANDEDDVDVAGEQPTEPATDMADEATFIHVTEQLGTPAYFPTNIDPHEAVQAQHDYASAEMHSPMNKDSNHDSSRDTFRDIPGDDDDVVEVTTTDETNLTGLRILGLAVAVRSNQQLVEPTTVRQALNGPDAEKWRAAMAAEVAALQRRGTWKLVPRRHAKGRKMLTGKWVFRIKTLADGTVKKIKARWVVRGFEQTQFVDYNQTFAPVGRHTSVRILLCIAAVKHRPLRKIDVSSAFLYPIVDAIIYVEQPHAFEEEGDAICLLQKSLYGIKQQAPRLWQQHLHGILIELGFQHLPHDQGMYRLESRGHFILLVAYVDDLLYTGDDTDLLDRFEREIQEKLEVTIDHEVTQFPGLNVTQTVDTSHLSAAMYAETLAKKFGIAPVGVTTPFRIPPPNHEPDTTPLSPADLRLYQQQLGCLLFAAVTCRPDLSYIASQLAQYLRRPEGENLADLRRALQYFISMPDVGLTYKANLTAPLQLTGYVDADHAGDIDNRTSRTGFIFKLEHARTISWNSNKQELIALSSAEA